jgi:DNA/RNA endonuclease G (NUC1)
VEVDMQEITFESQLLKDGHLSCPKKYAMPKAVYKVVVSLPDITAADSDIEMASVIDQSDEFISEVELSYYMNLDKQQ